ncbi:MAG: hypothetical protein QOE11_1838 [Solirubrobacteraceae bacterium]|jgi:hypothetical protein|nr:hypothetical protein [Solirubrobacteraceae bacterium]
MDAGASETARVVHRTSDPASRVLRLHPIRSLVLGPDGGFRDRMRDVIGDLGPVTFADVAMHDDADLDDLLALVRHERPDVLVLDATGWESAARRAVLALADGSPRTGVVVVCEHPTTAARHLGALPKWGWTQDLRKAVERACAEGRGPARRPAGPLAGWAEKGPRRTQ